MSRCLVVNADDFGRTPGVSQGILEAHLHGIVTSTTVMANLPSAPEAVQIALAEAPALAMGVHLNLTHGHPVLPASQVPSLVASAGSFFPYPELCSKIADVRPDEVSREWIAQIQRLLELGVVADHIDSHHFAAELTPDLWEVYIDLAKRFKLGARGPRPPKIGHQQIVPSGPEPQGVDFRAARAQLIASGVPTSDGLRVDFFGEDANQTLLLGLLKRLPEGVTELMVHPAIVDADLLASSGYAEPREAELAVLTSDATRHAVVDGDIRLTRFADALGA